jgi:hypothetical protein
MKRTPPPEEKSRAARFIFVFPFIGRQLFYAPICSGLRQTTPSHRRPAVKPITNRPYRRLPVASLEKSLEFLGKYEIKAAIVV